MKSFCDGKAVTAFVNGKPGPPPAGELERNQDELKQGVFQAAMVELYTGKDRHLKYLGKKMFDGKNCEAFERLLYGKTPLEVYIDPETDRELARVSKKEVTEVHRYEDSREFKGILYPGRTVITTLDGKPMRSFSITGLSTDFDDSVFTPKP